MQQVTVCFLLLCFLIVGYQPITAYICEPNKVR